MTSTITTAAMEDPSYFDHRITGYLPGVKAMCPDMIIYATYHLNPKTKLISKADDFRIHFEQVATVAAELSFPHGSLTKQIIGKTLYFEVLIMVKAFDLKLKADIMGSGGEFSAPHEIYAVNVKGSLDMVHWGLQATAINLKKK